MAKKKSKKKENKKKALKNKALKNKALKKKLKKLKKLKKKDSKKKESKKKEATKKSIEVQNDQKPIAKTSEQPKTRIAKSADLSANYKASEAIKKLRLLKSVDELVAFTKGEKRLTVKKVIPAAIKRLGK